MITGDQTSSFRLYDSDVRIGIDSFFATAAFRFGHVLVDGIYYRLDKDGNPAAGGHILLRDCKG